MNKAALERLPAAAPRRHAEGRRRHACRRAQELYDFLGYHAYEQKLDALFASSGAMHAPTPVPATHIAENR